MPKVTHPLRSELFTELEHEIQFFSSHTKQQYRAHVSDYLDFVAKKDPTLASWKERNTVYGYISFLQKRGLAQSYINTIVRGPVGCLFRFSGLRNPVKLPKVDRDPDRPEMTWKESQVEDFIQWARAKGNIQQQALLAVATIYAPRISEYPKITQAGIDTKKGVIAIPTSKHNLVRHHLIPAQIAPYIYQYDWEPLDEQELRNLFDSICEGAGIKRLPRQAFHAFRHVLWDELSYRGLTPTEIYDFTGWAKGGTLGYYVPPLKYHPQNDKKVFTVHPFLPYWE